MTVIEAIELYKNEITNEVFHLDADSILQDRLLKAIDGVTRTVIETYEAEKKKK